MTMPRLYADDKLICETPDSITISAEDVTDSITISAEDVNVQSSVIDSWSITCNQPISVRLNEDAFPFKAQTNCRNCGAPLNEHRDCEYCGTKYQMRSGVYMDAANIGFFAG